MFENQDKNRLKELYIIHQIQILLTYILYIVYVIESHKISVFHKKIGRVTDISPLIPTYH